MSWAATATIGSAVIGGAVASKGAKTAAKASKKGAAQQADAQREALAYLKETSALPTQMRDQALMGLGAAYLPGGFTQAAAPPYTGYGEEQDPSGWNEAAYLAANPDVAAGVERGWPESGRWHYENLGQFEGREPGTYEQQAGGAVIEGEAEELGPDWMYERAMSSGLYEGLAPKSQEELLQQAEASPLYRAIMSGQKQGEESILRNVSATGNLRAGGTIEGLADYSTNLQNRALMAGYGEALSAADLERRAQLTAYSDVRGGVGGLAQTPTNENAIANLYSGIGGTQAAGTIAAGQARQSGYQNMMGNIMGIAGLGIQAQEAGVFSDLRLKDNIEYVETRGEHHWYRWDWTDDAKEMLGLEGGSEGVLAHQVWEQAPEAVSFRDGFLTVDYGLLGEANAY